MSLLKASEVRESGFNARISSVLQSWANVTPLSIFNGDCSSNFIQQLGYIN